MSLTQLRLQRLKSFQRTLQIFNNILRQHIRLRKVIKICEALVFHPEYVQTLLVPLPDLINSEPSPSAVRILSRFQISSTVNLLHLPSGFSCDQVSFL